VSYKIVFLERGQVELENAVEWYFSKSEAAAAGLIKAVNDKMDKLRLNPFLFKKNYKNFHEVQLSKYPYSLVYLIDEESKLVVISAVYHNKRSPKMKYKK
jgi:plasmid stabilization system protein ParE